MNVPRKSVAYNGFFSLLDRGYTALSSLAIIPFIVHYLGMETYGIWVVLSTIANYFGLGTLGINSTFEKYIAQYNALQDEQSIRRFIATAFYASAVIGAGIFIVSIFCAKPMFHLFLKNDSLKQYTAVFILIMLSAALSQLSMIFVYVPRGLQRYDFSSVVSVIARTAYIVAVIVLCMRGFGLYSLIVAQYVFILVIGGLSLTLTRRFVTRLSFSPTLFDWSIFKTMILFGTKIQVGTVAVIIVQGFDKLLIAHFYGARLVAIYDIGSRLIMFLKDLPTFLFASMTSRTSELHSLDNHDKLKELYLVGTKYMSVICFAAIPLLFPITSEILNVWMRQPVDPLSIYVFQVLLISTMANATTGLGTAIGIGIGKPGIIAYSSIAMAVVNVVGSIAFFYAFGAKGVVWGTATGLIVATIYYYILLNRSMNVGHGKFLSSAISIPLLVNAAATFALLKLHDIGMATHPAFFSGSGRYGVIAANFVLVAMVSIATYAATKFITLEELLEYAPFLRRLQKK
jgi:O-antigen/teichoic acid export membrane protein